MASNYDKYRDVIRLTNQARRAALARLAETHKTEFQNLYLEEARARGLKPTKVERALKKSTDTEEAAFARMSGDIE